MPDQVNHPGPISEPLARMMTERNWRRFQRCEAARQRIIRTTWVLLLALAILIWEIFK